MGTSEWAQLGGAALSGSAVQWLLAKLFRRLLSDPKSDAEARKLNIQADDLIVQRLYAEIARLDRELNDVRQQQTDERAECAKEISEMQGQIRQLQQQQQSFGNFGSNAAEGPLRTAFRPDTADKDGDVIRKLNRIPGRKK